LLKRPKYGQQKSPAQLS